MYLLIVTVLVTNYYSYEMDIELNKTEIRPLCFLFEQDFMWIWMKNRQYTLQDRGRIIEVSGYKVVAG